MSTDWDSPQAIRARRTVATAMSRQAYRLERQLEPFRVGATERLGDARVAIGVWQMAAKLAEFGHLIVEGYRQRRYAPAVALVRTLFEEMTMLAWVALPDDAEAQRRRATQVALVEFRRAPPPGLRVPREAGF